MGTRDQKPGGAGLATPALLCLAALAGCAAPLLTTPGYRTHVYDAPGPAPVREEPKPVEDVSSLQDLALATARELALQRNHGVAAATAAVQAAEARIAEARAAFLPELDFGIDRKVNSDATRIAFPGGSFPINPPNTTRGQAQLTMSLFAFGRDVEAVNAARAEVDTEAFAERSARQKLMFEVTQAWFRVHEADSQVRVAEDALESARQQLEDATHTLEGGRTTEDAVLTARVEHLQKRQELLVARNAGIHARRVLNVLLVRAADAPLGLSAVPEPAPPGFATATLKEWAQDHNPSLLAYRSRRQALESRRESITRGFAPELRGSLGAEATDDRSATGSTTNFTATLGVHWTPVEGGRRIGQLQELHARLVELREQELQAIQTLGLDIDRAVLDAAEALSAEEVARSSIEAGTENLRIVRQRFQAGRANAREVLDAQRTLTGSRFQLHRARYEREVLIARVESLVGVSTADWPEAAGPPGAPGGQ